MKWLSTLLILMFFLTDISAADVASNFLINNRPMYQIVRQLHTDHLDSIEEKWIDSIRRYKTFYTEAFELGNHCRRSPKVYYKDRWEQARVAKSMVATLQMILFKTSISAIGKYADELELSSEEYENIYMNAINFSCSKNTTVMSTRRLIKSFKSARNSNFTLPSLNGNPLFTKKISDKQTREEKLINELYYTVGIFQSACSWGQTLEDLRLLQGLMQNKVVASYVIRQMAGLRIKESDSKNNQYMQKDKSTTKVYCDGLICREKTHVKFKQQFPRSGGSFSLVDDLKGVYCSEFLDYTKEDVAPLDQNYTDLINKYDGDEYYRVVGQFIALLTKLPDFNVWTKNKDTLQSYLKMGLDLFWDKWAQENVKRLVNKASYEEPLILESINKELFLNKKKFAPRVVFDLNSGEFDSSIAMNGKLKFKFDINILGKDLWWLFLNYKTGDTFDKETVARYDKLLKSYVVKDFKRYHSKFKNYIIDGDITDYIWKEIKSQLIFFDVYDFSIKEKSIYSIPVEINIAPFALVYLKNKHLMSESLKVEKSRSKRYQLQKSFDSMASDDK